MHRLALIQNQSEMAHYGYADAQPILSDLGYPPVLFTAYNVHLLPLPLKDHIDALVIASNALNDRIILERLTSEPLRSEIESFILTGGGLVCLHQLGLARMESETKLPFLPAQLRSASPTRRPRGERSMAGELAIPAGVAQHVLMVYPNFISADVLQSRSLSFRGLPGVYWHYWAGVGLRMWDTLVVDGAYGDGERPLVVVSKESDPYRVVLSALPLDWQRGRELLENIVTYVAEGRHSTAILTDGLPPASGLGYLTKILTSQRFPFRQYSLDNDTDRLARHIQDQVHTTLVLSGGVNQDRLGEPLRSSIDDNLREGTLRVLFFADRESGGSQFCIQSRNRYAIRLLQHVELLVQGELWRGYIDGSLWGTAETLRTLVELGPVPGHGHIDFGRLIDKILEEIDEHDRDGSYDETFGATCAAFWIRATYLGIQHPSATASIQWIRRNIGRYEDRERALAYQMFADFDILTDSERQELASVFSGLDYDRLTQSDIISYLRAALAARQVAALSRLVSALVHRHGNEEWVDLATAAEAGYLLLDAEDLLKRSSIAIRYEVYESIRQAASDIVVMIQENRDRDSSGDVYPWNSKANTSAKCVRAWLTFDSKLGSPVYEIVDTLVAHDRMIVQRSSGRTALTILEQLKEENDALQSRLDGVTSTAARAHRAITQARMSLVAFVVCVYLLVVVLAGGVSNGGKPLSKLLADAFVDPWGFHLAVASLLTAAVALPWSRWVRSRADDG